MLNNLLRRGRVWAKEPQKTKPPANQRGDFSEIFALSALPAVTERESLKSQLHVKE